MHGNLLHVASRFLKILSISRANSYSESREYGEKCHNFPEPKMTSSNCLFCLTVSPKHKDIKFTCNKEKQEIFSFESLEQPSLDVLLIHHKNCFL